MVPLGLTVLVTFWVSMWWPLHEDIHLVKIHQTVPAISILSNCLLGFIFFSRILFIFGAGDEIRISHMLRQVP